MAFKRLTASFSRPADNTAYQAGDAIANSVTGSAVVPLTFSLAGFRRGFLTGCRCVVTPASSNLVITALDFDLLLFRPATSIPFAAGSFPADNTAMAITAASYREFVGAFRFSAGAWRNTLGALTAGVTGSQTIDCGARPLFSFDVDEFSTKALIGVVQALGAWTPTGVANQFDFSLDADVE